MLKLFYSTSSAGGFFTPRAHKKGKRASDALSVSRIIYQAPPARIFRYRSSRASRLSTLKYPDSRTAI